MKTLLPTIALSFAPLLSIACGGDTAPSGDLTPLAEDYSVELLERFAAEALVAVQASYPTDVESVSIRFVESEEMTQLLLDEIRPQFVLQLEDEQVAEKSAELMAKAMERGLLAKTVMETGEIVLVRQNLFDHAEILGMTDFATEQVLQAVIVHEVVHVVDNHAHSLAELIGSALDVDGVQVVNAVIEGHAQFIARQVSSQMGNSAGFELFTEAIGAVVETEDPIEMYMKKVVASSFLFAYRNGELFFEQLAAAEPSLGFEHVLANLPTESVLIFEPQWYLDPSLRPVNAHDFAKVFTGLEERLESQAPDAWTSQVSTLLTPQIEAALSIVPKADYEVSLKEIIECDVMMARNTEQAGVMLAAGLFAMDSEPAAERLMDLQVKILAAKREQFSISQAEITKSVVRELTEDESDWIRGSYFQTDLQLGSRPFSASGILASRGDVVLELNFVSYDIDLSEAIEIAELLLGREPVAEEE
jgi:hypothetical protein